MTFSTCTFLDFNHRTVRDVLIFAMLSKKIVAFLGFWDHKTFFFHFHKCCYLALKNKTVNFFWNDVKPEYTYFLVCFVKNTPYWISNEIFKTMKVYIQRQRGTINLNFLSMMTFRKKEYICHIRYWSFSPITNVSFFRLYGALFCSLFTS